MARAEPHAADGEITEFEAEPLDLLVDQALEKRDIVMARAWYASCKAAGHGDEIGHQKATRCFLYGVFDLAIQ